jgi:hypothetical protein
MQWWPGNAPDATALIFALLAPSPDKAGKMTLKKEISLQSLHRLRNLGSRAVREQHPEIASSPNPLGA